MRRLMGANINNIVNSVTHFLFVDDCFYLWFELLYLKSRQWANGHSIGVLENLWLSGFPFRKDPLLFNIILVDPSSTVSQFIIQEATGIEWNLLVFFIHLWWRRSHLSHFLNNLVGIWFSGIIFICKSLVLLISINIFNQKSPIPCGGCGSRLLYHKPELGLGGLF